METDHQAVSEHYSTTKTSDYMDFLVRSHRKEATPDISNSTVKHGTPQKTIFSTRNEKHNWQLPTSTMMEAQYVSKTMSPDAGQSLKISLVNSHVDCARNI